MKYAIACAFLFHGCVHGEYQRLDVYATLLCNIIAQYLQENDTASEQDVTNFIASSATQTVFSDSKNAGYTKQALLFEAYQYSFTVEKQNPVVINGLHNAYVAECASKETATAVAQYSTYTTLGTTFMMLLWMIRSAYVYFKFDRPTLNFYRTNDQAYLKTQLTHGSPLLPEPIIPILN